VAAWLFEHEKLSRDKAIEAEAVKAANEAIARRETNLKETIQKRLEEYDAGLQVVAA
jgi:hypothetical protein